MHRNFINILRFSHRSPHLFATASFDHSCKACSFDLERLVEAEVWDLRQPMQLSRPAHAPATATSDCCSRSEVKLFTTDTLNVMCTFSPVRSSRTLGSSWPLLRTTSTSYALGWPLACASLPFQVPKWPRTAACNNSHWRAPTTSRGPGTRCPTHAAPRTTAGRCTSRAEAWWPPRPRTRACSGSAPQHIPTTIWGTSTSSASP